MEENRRIDPGDASRGEIEIVDEDVVWSNPVVQLLNARVRFPAKKDGEHEEGMQFRLSPAEDKDDGVVIVPIDENDRILLIRQFRHPIRMWLRELPRGARERGEPPREAAARELREETGYEVVESYALGRIVNDSGQLTGFPFLYAARARRAGESEPEDTEAICGMFRYSFTELKRACWRGEINDSFTLVAVARLAPHFDGDRFVYRPEEAPMEED